MERTAMEYVVYQREPNHFSLLTTNKFDAWQQNITCNLCIKQVKHHL